MWWGYSQSLDLREEMTETSDETSEPLEFLIVGASDARHVIKTLASAYKHTKRSVNFHVIEPFLEQIARSMLLLSTVLESNLGIQEGTRYYSELLGNILLRPATAKYLVQRTRQLIDIPTKTVDCPWLNLDRLKHRDRDNLESIFKFWERAACEGLPMVEYWDRRVRKALSTRYDYREGAFDWDYHMVLKDRGDICLTPHEYRFWRNNGVAFTWIEGEPARCNPTLISNIVSHGKGFLHHAYMGDISTGPYFTWGLDAATKTGKMRATDATEREVMRAIHEVRQEEPMCDEAAAAHRDPSLLNAIIAAEMPDNEIEQEKWVSGVTFKRKKNQIEWKSVPGSQIIFHPIKSLETYKDRSEFQDRFDVVWLASNMTKQLANVAPLAKPNSKIIVESRKFIVELRKDDFKKFNEELIESAKAVGLEAVSKIDAEQQNIIRFVKRKSR